jgi:hypothetical protein
MTEPSTGRMKQGSVESERGRLIRPPQRLLDKLQPFDYSDAKLGLRRGDVETFLKVAADTETIIVLRATNPESVRYIGVKGYTSKPFDCKAKTAKSNDLVREYFVECAGLVVDPSLLSRQVFDGNSRVKDYWHDFTLDNRRMKSKDGVQVYPRKEGKGFYAVDTAPPSTTRRHYGCLMLSTQDPPKDFDPARSHTRAWMQQNMAYVHGDYDLYGVIDAAAIDRKRGVNALHAMDEPLSGSRNYFTERTKAVQKCLNDAIGFDMVHHGEQVAYEFKADNLYVFAPNGGKWRILEEKSKPEMIGMLADLFRYVFGSEVVRPTRS